jgi:hypothetical protein
MTAFRADPDGPENFFDRLFSGIGHRGSSFTDVDGLSHDVASNRFLMFEYKRPFEKMSKGQQMALFAFSALPGCEFWGIRRTGEFFDVIVCQSGRQTWRGTIGWDALRSMYRGWWDGETWIPAA